MPYGDYTDLTARQRVAALKALLNLVLSSEDVHERIAQRAEAYRSQRQAKDAPAAPVVPAAPDSQTAAASGPAVPPRGAAGLRRLLTTPRLVGALLRAMEWQVSQMMLYMLSLHCYRTDSVVTAGCVVKASAVPMFNICQTWRHGSCLS